MRGKRHAKARPAAPRPRQAPDAVEAWSFPREAVRCLGRGALETTAPEYHAAILAEMRKQDITHD